MSRPYLLSFVSSKLTLPLSISHRDRQASAQKLYSHLPAHYVDLRWVKIESSLLTECTRLQGTLDMSRERLLSTLALIRAGVEFGSKTWSLDAVEDPSVHRSRGEDMTTLAKKLMDDVYSLSSTLSKGGWWLFELFDPALTLPISQTSPPSPSRPSRCAWRANMGQQQPTKTA